MRRTHQLLTEEQRSDLGEIIEAGGVEAPKAAEKLLADDLHRAELERIASSAVRDDDGDTLRPVLTYGRLGAGTLSAPGFVGPSGGGSFGVGSPTHISQHNGQMAGWFPFCVSTGIPVIGPILGQTTGGVEGPFCFDGINWQFRGGIITAPISMILALNGLGKSTLVRNMVDGQLHQGRIVLAPGDQKPDLVKQCRARGGAVVSSGIGEAVWNPLDPGPLLTAANELAAAAETIAEPNQRSALDRRIFSMRQTSRASQVELVSMIIATLRHGEVTVPERTVLTRAIEELDAIRSSGGLPGYRAAGGRSDEVGTQIHIADIYQMITEPNDNLLRACGIGFSGPGLSPEWKMTHYATSMQELSAALEGLSYGQYGQMFNGDSTVSITLEACMTVVDVSGIPSSHDDLRTAVLKASWMRCFDAVQAQIRLQEWLPDIYPKRNFFVVLDELWHVLRQGADGALAQRVDELSRLSRTIGCEVVLITHSIKDLPGDAIGLFERSRIKFFGALPRAEIERIRAAGVNLSETAGRILSTWGSAESLPTEAVKDGEKVPPPPGQGAFMAVVGEGRAPGQTFRTVISPTQEREGIHNTNDQFDHVGKKLAGGRR